jgi:hypothetical protein
MHKYLHELLELRIARLKLFLKLSTTSSFVKNGKHPAGARS